MMSCRYPMLPTVFYQSADLTIVEVILISKKVDTGCGPQYSHWEYTGNMVNFHRLYLQYFQSGNMQEILWKQWKYSKYRGYFIIFPRYFSGNMVDIICGCLLYFQWLYCGLHPVGCRLFDTKNQVIGEGRKVNRLYQLYAQAELPGQEYVNLAASNAPT